MLKETHSQLLVHKPGKIAGRATNIGRAPGARHPALPAASIRRCIMGPGGF
jgi:hypothetical protein